MPKGLDANVLAQTDAVQSRPVLLFTITLAESGTLRYAASQLNITFPTGGNVYTAKAILMSNIIRRAEGQIVRAVIQFDNVAKDMSGYAAAESFDGQAISVKRIWRDAVGSAAYYNEILNGYMEEVTSIGREWMEVKVIEGKSLQRQALIPIYQKLCNHRFGDSQCNADSLANLIVLTASGTADSGSATTLADNALVQVADYWNYGQIEIIKSGAKYRRKVKDFVANIAAQGTITMAGIAVANETFVIDTQTFTWKAARGIAGEVTIGANAAEAVTNIVTAVTADLATVTAVDGAGDTVVITAVTAKGTAGNGVVLTEASTNMTVNGSGTLGATTAGVDAVITFDVALPVAVDNTCTYETWKGCSQTWDSCQMSNAWGPSGDNKANFLGFIHIGKTMGLRDWRTG